jgi:hypothetical protein
LLWAERWLFYGSDDHAKSIAYEMGRAMTFQASRLVIVLVVAAVSLFAAALLWPATVRICVANQSGGSIHDLRFTYASCDLHTSHLRSGEVIACDVSARGQADGATLMFTDAAARSVGKQITMYFAQGDYGTYHVLLKSNELYWGPRYRNGAFAAFRSSGACDTHRIPTGFTRIPYWAAN